ncbi:chemotaxis protein CheW [Stenotrophomonas maltophilia]|uniref:Chemotaxis protein CheW n=1 Tax=Stenotrophomonas riyadhensis TaxID=2859893 RepID=A0ABT2XBI0_9GAMM|nr:chemotaxis protein CheW [Stenotrophomonas sp. CFS3442]MBH1619673.1 chemotaxis protein CheW [Stenotrophomonas maltophilia]MCV0323289.1 chemotaxis protein CheW [Stenotrophomonas sp. CFS3442]HEL4244561.1 chemotaxis protein CheW [Stenotrophomonas maltophilia]
MNSSGVLDDYLDELLGEAIAPAAVVLPTPDSAAPASASASEPEREPTWDDLPAEVIYETETVAAAPAVDNATLEAAFEAAATAEREPTWDDLPAEVIYETGTASAATAEDDAALEAAFEAAAMPVAALEREPTWDDLPDEVIHETAPAPATAKAGPEPTWDDLPDEVIYETDTADSHRLAHTDSPGLQAAFEAAAGGEDVATPPPAVVAAPVAAQAQRPAPAARAAAAPPPRVAVDAPASSRPSNWQELQAQAHQPARSPHPQNRRAGERTSRWLRLRCGTQAYALELLKVQEVVLPVPLLPLRGTAPAMLGIMNLRGQVVPVMDLGLHLGAAAAEDDSQTRIVVLEEDGETIGLRVSAVEDVANLTDSQIEPPDTARICQISNDLFRGVARVSQRPMILLDATRLLN